MKHESECVSLPATARPEQPRDRVNDREYIGYFKKIRSSLEPYFKAAMATGFKNLQAEKARLEIKTSSNRLVARYAFTVNANGVVTERQMLCGLGVPELDRALQESFKNLKSVEVPPADLVKKDPLVHAHWEFVVTK